MARIARCILMLTMELTGVGEDRLHAYGATLVALRVLHAVALYDEFDAPTWRKMGRAVSAAGAAALLAAGGVALLV
ncbi:MAG: MAPEG family protein [Pseudomonadota bacterium]